MIKKEVKIDYLYLDLNTCERCIDTDKVLEEALKVIQPILEFIDYEITYQKIEIQSIDYAEKYHFLSSPTIRVNGLDIYSSVSETKCECCSNISGNDITCRVFEHEEQIYEIPPIKILVEATLKAIFTTSNEIQDSNYEVPQNIKTFFEGKLSKEKACTCENGCC